MVRFVHDPRTWVLAQGDFRHPNNAPLVDGTVSKSL